MSPHIKHGVIQNRELLNIIQDKFNFQESEKFIQELAWRDFWRSYAYHHPDQLWTDVEEYKTGFKSSDYLDDLPEDIEKGETPTQVINSFIQELKANRLPSQSRSDVCSFLCGSLSPS